MADGTPRKPSITLGNEVCNINASEPGSATKADGALVRLPGFVVDDVLAGTGSTAAGTTTAGTSDVPVVVYVHSSVVACSWGSYPYGCPTAYIIIPTCA